MVVRSAPSGAVLRTASPSAPLILGASSPMDLASNRIGTTSATTARTTTIPMTQPSVQPKLLGPLVALRITREEVRSVSNQTVSQKSLTGFRFAFTEVSRSGTVLVRSATARTPPVVATRVARMARRWKITRSSATAVSAMMTAAMISVTQAAAGIVGAPFWPARARRSAEQLRDRARVPDGTDRHGPDGVVGRGRGGRGGGQAGAQGHT